MNSDTKLLPHEKSSLYKTLTDDSPSYPHPIYFHYSGNDRPHYIPEEINENEFYKAMSEAEQSYASWKQMQKHLKSLIQR